MTRGELAIRADVLDVPDECIRAAASLFASVHAAPTLQNAERLVHWLGQHPLHARALDIALTQWGLAQSGHSATFGITATANSSNDSGVTACLDACVPSANGG
ncbi:hypothetical protein VLK31_26825 [Variovorax sp. H27-G14]|uniref:hypothetical protein n=1 Tax=Variovorax sp. H27-G14 TaxID=3111914 RepID=UPI0038FD1E1B